MNKVTYNSEISPFSIINLNFPLILYKKLLGSKVGSIEDLKELEPGVAKGLKDLLDYEGDDLEDVFGLSFAIDREFCGEVKSVPLRPDGAKIPVTQRNKEEYVQEYINFVLNKGIDTGYTAFHKGFHKVSYPMCYLMFIHVHENCS